MNFHWLHFVNIKVSSGVGIQQTKNLAMIPVNALRRSSYMQARKILALGL